MVANLSNRSLQKGDTMSAQGMKTFLFSFILASTATVMFMNMGGCTPAWWVDPDLDSREQGGVGTVLQMPIPEGQTMLCTQGANGETSHRAISTKMDVDFDTPNFSDMELFAPVSGTVRVHIESSGANFGYHLIIDIGGGKYVVVGHMKKIFVKDGDEVAMGQLIGYEGCTGFCSGDHVHLGLHTGDAKKKAEYGTSVESWIRARDVSDGGEMQSISTDDLVCGLTSGHTYESDLKVTKWHPDGSLLKMQNDAKIYRVDDGRLRWIENEEVFWSYGYDFKDVMLMSKTEFACYEKGPNIGQKGMVKAAYDNETGTLWLIVGSPEHSDRFRQRIAPAWVEVLKSWGLDYSASSPPPVIDSEDALMTDWPLKAGFAKFRDGSLLSEFGDSTVYVVSNGWALPVMDWDTYLMLGNLHREVIEVKSGDVRAVQGSLGSCEAGVMCLDRKAITTCGGGLDVNGGNSGGELPPGNQTETNPPEDTGDLPEETDEDPVDTGMNPDPVDTDPPTSTRTLHLEWATPFGAIADEIRLSGEYTFASGAYGFTWRDLSVERMDNSVEYDLAGVGRGDKLRFSVAYDDMLGTTSWSCIGPFPPGTPQGTVQADVDGIQIPSQMVGDPTGLTTGCGLILTIP